MKKVSPRIFLHFAPCLAEFTKDEARLKLLRAGANVTQDLWHMCCLVVTKPWHWSRSRKDKLFISDALDQVINAQAACWSFGHNSRSIWCRNSGKHGFLSKFHWRSLEHHAMPPVRVPLSTAGSKIAVLWGSSSLANAGVFEALTATGRACWNAETEMDPGWSKRTRNEGMHGEWLVSLVNTYP